jgi:hypothetical protein
LDQLERVNLNHWTAYVSITTAIQTPEIRLCQWKVTGKVHNKICDKACTDDRKGGGNFMQQTKSMKKNA